MIKKILGAWAASAACSAWACEAPQCLGVTLGLHLYTHHIEAPAGLGLRDSNPGLNLKVTRGALRGLTVGALRNSYDRTSVYVAWTAHTPGQAFALSLGAISGYRNPPRATVADPQGFDTVTYRDNDVWLPLLVPSMRLATPVACASCAVRVAYLPKRSEANAAAGIHLSVERGF
jgi:hypothetical protein